MYLFIDTETTGLVREDLPVEHDGQPHLVQIAWILCDESATIRSHGALIIDEGVEIPERVVELHGIDGEIARSCGVRPETALTVLEDLAQRATRLVGHNVEFDRAVLRTAAHRCGRDFSTIGSLPVLDTMIRRRLPLRVLYRELFGRDLQGRHDAMTDVMVTHQCFFELSRHGAISVAAANQASGSRPAS